MMTVAQLVQLLLLEDQTAEVRVESGGDWSYPCPERIASEPGRVTIDCTPSDDEEN